MSAIGVKEEQDVGNTAMSRYHILRELYPDNEIPLGELADRTRIDDGNLSRYVAQLSGMGLLSVRSEKGERSRGKPRKMVRLTEASRGFVDSLVKLAGSVPASLEPADTGDIGFYLTTMDDSNSIEAQRMAAEEFRALCHNNLVMHDDRVLPFLRNRIFDPKYTALRDDLLNALLGIVRNATCDEKRAEIKSEFSDPLRSLLSNPPGKPGEDLESRSMALQILGMLSEGDKDYDSLMRVLMGLIRRGDSLAERMQETIVARYPEKRNDIRRTLFTMLSDQDGEVVRKAKNHIRLLRDRTPR
jgi:DNA-binding MarR family transcriptional regulator